LRQTSAIVFCAVDGLLPIRGKIQAGFDEFCAALEHAGVPMVWVTDRSRAQMDEPIRRLDHRHPFIAEGGCGAYLPEGYFNLKAPKAVRMARFTCIPTAQVQPAAAEALEGLSEETGVPVVTLKSLSPRELAQNLGLPAREAEAARQRDFDERFFFAGAAEPDIARFQEEARQRKLVLRQHGVLWSLSVGGNVAQAVRELVKLYERVLRLHPTTFGIATTEEAGGLLPTCDRKISLGTEEPPQAEAGQDPRSSRTADYSLAAPDLWERVLAAIPSR
jgi:mannosyl-3-phosphoglycerate phosphatase